MVTDPVPPSLPRAVRHRVRDVIEVTGLEPDVEVLSPVSWRVVLRGTRVVAGAEFTARNGAAKETRTYFTVDGKEHKVPALKDLRTHWDRYEAAGAARAELVPVPPLPPARVVPAEVRQLRATLAANTAAFPVSVGFDGRRWVIGADFGAGDGLRIFAVRTPLGRWAMKPGTAGDRPVQLIIGGEDRSAEAEDSLDKAMKLAAASYPDAGAADGVSPVSLQPGSRDNGVETRRMVVLRELKGTGCRCPAPGRQHWRLNAT